MSKTYSAGIVTAYGAAKRAGYTGTYEDFCRQQAGYAESAATVEQAKNIAVSAANTATTKAGEAATAATAAQTAKTQTEAAASRALTDISTARSGAISAVQTEGQTQTANARAQAQAAAQSATTASTKASEASASATSAGRSATNADASATSAAQSASNAQDVFDSIPADYSDLSEDVDKLKADLGDLENLMTTDKSSIVAAINEAAQSGGGGGGGSSTLAGLTDTALSSVQGGQVLTYNGTSSKWVNRTPAIEVVDTYSDLTGTTAQYVLVENNNGDFGDGGQCWFEKRNGETERTIVRNDGSYVGPTVGQGTLSDADVSYNDILYIARGYVGNNNLSYGTSATLFDSTCGSEIDCSAFVCAVLQGIMYSQSRYVLGTSELNKLGENAGYKLPSGAVRIGALNTGELVSYFAQHKQLFYFPSTINAAVRMLRVGDIVFTGADTVESQQKYLGIDHAIIILCISPDYNSISYIQAGGGGTFVNESTVVNTAFRTIDANYPLSHFKAFARPNYGKALVDRASGVIDALTGGVYHFDTKFIPNLYCTPATGEMSFSQNFWSDPCFHSVVPGESIVCSTSAGLAHAIFYDSAYNRITNTSITTAKTVPENAKYVRFNIGFAAASGSHVTLAIADGTTITMSLTDKQHLDAVYADLGDKSHLETLDKTNIVSAINSLNGIVRIIANRDTSWAGIRENVKLGYGEILYPVGTDFSVSCPSGAPYNDIVFTVVNHRVENDEPIMTLLMKRCIYGIQFDAPQAAFVASEAMAAGTYHFKLLDGYDTGYDGGKYVQFTIVNPLVAGDQIVITWGSNQSWIGKNAYVYHAFEATPAETCVMSEGQGGTYLGVADGSSANLNHTHRLRYGSNNWKESAVREWLNSDAQAGSWQTQQARFQRPCSYASSKAGFISYLDPSFVATIRTGTHLNRTNQVFDILGTNVAYSTEERFFLLSNEELGFTSESGIVCGSLFSFYDGANNNDRIKYDISNENTARNWWLRTPSPSYAYFERSVSSSGALNSTAVYNGAGAAAACEI